MIKNYQQRKELEREATEPANANLATVAGVYSDGISLRFDGELTATTKRYKRNATITFAVGQRVKVAKIAGTYIVEYPIT